MDETFLPKKLSMVAAIKKVPTNVSSSIMRINDVRNALAHSLIPQNRRRYWAEKKVTYRAVPLFSCEGVLKFHEDYDIVHDYFWKRVFGWYRGAQRLLTPHDVAEIDAEVRGAHERSTSKRFTLHRREVLAGQSNR
ncbi:MAG: hypothetical protein ABSG18_19095 [Steroidobacteraceae bacterium]|jgi:hypothetical protein